MGPGTLPSPVRSHTDDTLRHPLRRAAPARRRPRRRPGRQALAQEVLDKGAALFDARDAKAMAATYTEDAEIRVISKDQGSGTYKTQAVRGRQAIEKGYQDLFKKGQTETKSKNRVEFAHFVRPDLLAIHGQFQPDTSKEGDDPVHPGAGEGGGPLAPDEPATVPRPGGVARANGDRPARGGWNGGEAGMLHSASITRRSARVASMVTVRSLNPAIPPERPETSFTQ